ncbi:hypothetical protein D0T12_31770 [Actinomadura spongiicola]|uniref:FtsX extracellular domain-containing protein n=1 Tax=Actinomadura spongiicola TaxID=2303421 RepID=A0A372G8Y2_9ACTN|nr:permease-like cell division protein FtsX [Actinomadura spongiicola]RFS81523.1 hypothetical protein D0T12_31770 [Actinomadura spongiicola]
MNGSEERLRDALHHVGDIVQPGDVPPPPFPAKRRRVFARPMTMGAVVAATVVAISGVAVGGNALLDRTAGESSAQNAAASGEQRLSVFLCAKTSSKWACKAKDATEQQRQDIERRLRALPGVRRVDYVSRTAAYRSFKKEFDDDKNFPFRVTPANISPFFQVRVEGTVDVKAMKAKVESVPGVDTVIVVPRKAGA